MWVFSKHCSLEFAGWDPAGGVRRGCVYFETVLEPSCGEAGRLHRRTPDLVRSTFNCE